RAVEMANKYNEGVYATVGLHPIHTDKSRIDADELGVPRTNPVLEPSAQYGAGADQDQKTSAQGFMSRGEEFDYEYYKKLAQDPKVVAIGECGLDFYRATSDKRQETRKKQEEVFIKQIELAHEIKKPLMIHCRAHPKPEAKEGREAYDDLIHILDAKRFALSDLPGVIHFFSGTKEQAQKLLDLGFYFTFGGVITFARDYDGVIKYIPLDRILLETDAPYVTPAPHRGQRNEPLYVVEVAKKVGEIKDAEFDKILTITTENARNVLGM
ncbi:MAG: TatD family hydrolase, partial [Patescibacteria group bacterium]